MWFLLLLLLLLFFLLFYVLLWCMHVMNVSLIDGPSASAK